MNEIGYVYIMASCRNGTRYTGVTNDILRRVSEHRDGLVPGFTLEHDIKTLVWYELLPDIETAIRREKSIKRWRREWKLELIEQANPEWHDLWPTLSGEEVGAALSRVKLGPGSSPG